MLSRNIYWELQARMKQREADSDFQQVRGERQWKMEGIFAEAKDNHGLSRARYRGRGKMQIQAYMISFVQNLKRLMDLCPDGPVLLLTRFGKILENFFKKQFSRRAFDNFSELKFGHA